jgi:hypothetical protein
MTYYEVYERIEDLGFFIVTPDFTRKTECISYVRQDQIRHT